MRTPSHPGLTETSPYRRRMDAAGPGRAPVRNDGSSASLFFVIWCACALRDAFSSCESATAALDFSIPLMTHLWSGARALRGDRSL